MAKRIDVSDLNIFYGDFRAVADVSVSIEPRSVTALILIILVMALNLVARLISRFFAPTTGR